jgi:hypothetical protein
MTYAENGWGVPGNIEPLGGERRLAFWSETDLRLPDAPEPPKNATRIRRQLLHLGHPDFMQERNYPCLQSLPVNQSCGSPKRV